ncbi:hypothetical protein GQX74_004409 [Glossina fuscipes]|nr:hypothetical protein GQX74_004409 [Glossina fuscipes]
MNFTLASVVASGTSNNSLSTNSSSYARNQNINRFATSLNNNITSIFKTPQNLASALRDKRVSDKWCFNGYSNHHRSNAPEIVPDVRNVFIFKSNTSAKNNDALLFN